jgi:RNA polymerase sigma factor (sigma-70 family)
VAQIRNQEGLVMATADAEFHALMARLRQGDPDAAATLLQQYGDEVRDTVRRHLAHEARRVLDSADVVQSVWREFFTHDLPTRDFANEEELRHYLRCLSRFKALDANRRYLGSQRRNLHRECSLDGLSAEDRQRLLDPSPSPAEAVEAQDALEAVIASLPPRYGQVIILLSEGYTHVEIAERIGRTERTVERIVSQLLQLPCWLSGTDPL